MTIQITGVAKEIAALVLAIQERQTPIVNNLVLNPVDGTSGHYSNFQ